MKTFDEIREGYKSMAQQRAVWASKADGGKGHPDNKKKSKKEDVNEISKDMAGRYLEKVPASAAAAGRDTVAGSGKVPLGVAKVINRYKGTKTAVDKLTGKAKVPATESVEETVNELDTSTLVSYRKKANKQRYSNNISKRIQRTAGVDRADKKLRARNIDKFGDHSPKGVDKMGNPKEDSDAVKAFLAKGGKIKKLPPAKAQGYHGKDDPGKDIHGVMDKPDTKAMGTRKKVKSMESKSFFDLRNELSK